LGSKETVLVVLQLILRSDFYEKMRMTRIVTSSITANFCMHLHRGGEWPCALIICMERDIGCLLGDG
jgi:hypothetical protein